MFPDKFHGEGWTISFAFREFLPILIQKRLHYEHCILAFLHIGLLIVNKFNFVEYLLHTLLLMALWTAPRSSHVILTAQTPRHESNYSKQTSRVCSYFPVSVPKWKTGQRWPHAMYFRSDADRSQVVRHQREQRTNMDHTDPFNLP
jgi:hypothetical protein